MPETHELPTQAEAWKRRQEQKEEAYKEGERARADGFTRGDNPYRADRIEETCMAENRRALAAGKSTLEPQQIRDRIAMAEHRMHSWAEGWRAADTRAGTLRQKPKRVREKVAQAALFADGDLPAPTKIRLTPEQKRRRWEGQSFAQAAPAAIEPE